MSSSTVSSISDSCSKYACREVNRRADQQDNANYCQLFQKQKGFWPKVSACLGMRSSSGSFYCFDMTRTNPDGSASQNSNTKKAAAPANWSDRALFRSPKIKVQVDGTAESVTLKYPVKGKTQTQVFKIPKGATKAETSNQHKFWLEFQYNPKLRQYKPKLSKQSQGTTGTSTRTDGVVSPDVDLKNAVPLCDRTDMAKKFAEINGLIVTDLSKSINSRGYVKKTIGQFFKHEKIDVKAHNEQIKAGRDIYNQIIQSTSDENRQKPDKLEDVINLMYYIYTETESSLGGGFKEGAVKLRDPDGHLRRYLDDYQLSYRRKSSHLAAFTKYKNGTHRGIDVVGGQRFPRRMKTLLYATLSDDRTTIIKKDNTNTWPMPEPYLFLKLEGHGAQATSKFFKLRKDEGDPGPRRVSMSAYRETFSHSVSYLSGTALRRLLGKKQPEGTFKERIPKDLAKRYKALIKSAPTSEIQEALSADKPWKDNAAGIRILAERTESAIAHNKEKLPITFVKEAEVFIRQLEYYPQLLGGDLGAQVGLEPTLNLPRGHLESIEEGEEESEDGLAT